MTDYIRNNPKSVASLIGILLAVIGWLSVSGLNTLLAADEKFEENDAILFDRMTKLEISDSVMLSEIKHIRGQVSDMHDKMFPKE